MAITRTQIARQLYRIGGVGGRAKEGSVERTGGSSNRERGITQQFKGPSGTTGRIDTRDADPRRPDRRAVSQFSQFGRNVMAQNLKPKRFQGLRSLASRFNPLSFILGLINPALGIASRFVTSAPDTFQTFKESPTLADFLENMKTKKISDISVDSGRGSGLRPTIDMKKPIEPISESDMSIPTIERISESDMSLLTPEQKKIIDDTQNQEDDEFLNNAIAGLTKKQQQMLAGPQKNLKNIMDISDEQILENIAPFNDPNDPATLQEVRNFYKVADGGMIGGGIMDAAGRQQYFLGKLVKKAKRAVKKIVKSPIGKIGLLAAGGFGLNKAFPFMQAGKLTGAGKLFGGGLLSLAPFIFGNQEDDTQQLASMGSVGGQIDPRAYTNPRDVLFPAFRMAEGGRIGLKNGEGIMKVASAPDIMDSLNDLAQMLFGKNLDQLTDEEYDALQDAARDSRAEGGSMKEPVAKKTMPLLDMGGQEMDLRAEGGFVPIGRMEKADDVPARLSKNEFVFTADAVRNAGDGDVDKGAEVMYNMMKNLEAGGDVSEESQGLKGAREMFQTSKRLEEVI